MCDFYPSVNQVRGDIRSFQSHISFVSIEEEWDLGPDLDSSIQRSRSTSTGERHNEREREREAKRSLDQINRARLGSCLPPAGLDMTVTVLATSTTKTKTKRRDPLLALEMAPTQAQARHAAPGRKTTRSAARLSLTNQENEAPAGPPNGVEKKKKSAKRSAGEFTLFSFFFFFFLFSFPTIQRLLLLGVISCCVARCLL